MRRLALLLLCLVFCTAACAKPLPDFTGTIISATDALGNRVSLPYKPQRVAVLFSSLANIWGCAGGNISVTVYESVERGFADADVQLVDGGAGKSIDTEALIASTPDLVIGSADIAAQVDAVTLCRNVGIPAVLLRVESFADYLAALELCTTLTGETERYATYGNALASEIQKKIDTFDARGAKVLFIRAGSAARYTKAKTAADHFAAAMLAELGTVNIADSAPILLDGLSFEEILSCDPDHIFVSTMGEENAAIAYMESLLLLPEWQALSAVQNGNLHYLPKSLFQYKPNARWGEAYDYLIDCLEDKK